ncbi:MAG: hypothetical protein ACREQ5_10590 [Candidatus Dormibacteria bacterium]
MLDAVAACGKSLFTGHSERSEEPASYEMPGKQQIPRRLRRLGMTNGAFFRSLVGALLGTVQALLGHVSPEVTRQIYLHAIPEEQRKAVEDVEKLLIGPKWTQISEVAQRPN